MVLPSRSQDALECLNCSTGNCGCGFLLCYCSVLSVHRHRNRGGSCPHKQLKGGHCPHKIKL